MIIAEKDLWDECAECGGSGSIDGEKSQNEYASENWASCPCEKCNGIGRILTPSGEVLKEFMRCFVTNTKS